jgi:hypothetical protein
MFETAAKTAADTALTLTPHQVVAYLAIVTILVMLSMTWTAWAWLLRQLGKALDRSAPPPPPAPPPPRDRGQRKNGDRGRR